MSLTTEDSKDLIALLVHLQNEGIKAASINWGMRNKEFVFQVLERGGRQSYYRKDKDHFARI